MSAQVRVTVWQHAASLDPKRNRDDLTALAPSIEDTDLLVLPEASARDFGEPGSALGPYAEPLDGPFAGTLAAVAAQRGTSVLGGMFEVSEDDGRPYNTLVLAGPTGFTTYRKIHLYDSFGMRESDVVSPGPLAPVVARVGDLPIGLMTCYDLRFPELARALSAAGAEALVLPAAWVAGRGKVDQWRTLLRARAIENLCWVVAAGQPGPRYCGHSMVVAPTGDVVAEAGDGEELIKAVLDLDAVAEARRRNPSLDNRRL